MVISESVPVTPVKKLGPGEQHAINKFAEAKGLTPEKVTLEMVCNSPEKLLHWATLDREWGARSASSQAFFKSKRTQANEGDRTIYLHLDEPLKREYRQHWDLKRDYTFTKETKIIKMTFEKESVDRGLYRTEEQIAVHLGLAGFPMPGPERTRILKMANNYTKRCQIFGGRWLLQNQWLGDVAEETEMAEAVEMFLWMEKMVTTTCRSDRSIVGGQA